LILSEHTQKASHQHLFQNCQDFGAVLPGILPMKLFRSLKTSLYHFLKAQHMRISLFPMK